MLTTLLNKWNGMPISIKASIAFTFSSFFIKGVSFITTPIFTRIMDTTQYGIISTYNAWNLLIEVFAVLGMTSAGIINVGLNDYKNNRDRYISAITGLGNIITIIFFGILFTINELFPNIINLPNSLLIIMFIHFLFYPAQIYWITKQRYELKYKSATFLSIFSSIVSQIIAVVVVINSDNNQGFYKICSNEIGILIIAIPLYMLVIHKGHIFFDLKIWKQVLFFAIPLIPHYLAQHIMSSADRIMLSSMVSEAEAGIYNLIYNIGWIATLLWTAINASLTPFLYDEFNNSSYEKTKRVTKIILIGFSLACIFACVVAPEILKILAPQEYYTGVYAIPPIVAVAYMNALYNIYSSVEFYYKEATYIAKATVISALVNVALNIVLIPKFAFIGAAYTTLISYIVMIILHYHGYRNVSEERKFDDNFILKYSIFICISCICCTFLYTSYLIRFTVLLFILFLLLIMRKKLYTIIIELKKEMSNYNK